MINQWVRTATVFATLTWAGYARPCRAGTPGSGNFTIEVDDYAVSALLIDEPEEFFRAGYHSETSADREWFTSDVWFRRPGWNRELRLDGSFVWDPALGCTAPTQSISSTSASFTFCSPGIAYAESGIPITSDIAISVNYAASRRAPGEYTLSQRITMVPTEPGAESWPGSAVVFARYAMSDDGDRHRMEVQRFPIDGPPSFTYSSHGSAFKNDGMLSRWTIRTMQSAGWPLPFDQPNYAANAVHQSLADSFQTSFENTGLPHEGASPELGLQWGVPFGLAYDESGVKYPKEGVTFTTTIHLDVMINRWEGSAGGDFHDRRNWTGGYAPGDSAGTSEYPASVARFTGGGPGTVTIRDEEFADVSHVLFRSDQSYTIAGPGYFHVQQQLHLAQGDHVITAPFGSGYQVLITGPGQLTLRGDLDWWSGAPRVMGTLNLELAPSSNAYVNPRDVHTLIVEPGGTVNAGGLNDPFTDDVEGASLHIANASALHILSGAKAVGILDGYEGHLGDTVIAAGASLAADRIRQHTLAIGADGHVTIRPGGADVSLLNSLDLAGEPDAWIATFDLADSGLVLQATAADAARVFERVRNQIAYARNDGVWDRPGLTSSAAAGDSRKLTTLAAILNRDSDGKPLLAYFGDLPIDANSVLVRYTYYGDGNLDGVVNAEDYLLLDRAFLEGSPASFANGDYNQDGRIDIDDYFLIDLAYSSQPAPLSVLVGTVPEPGSFLLPAALLGWLLKRPFQHRRRARSATARGTWRRDV